MKKYIKTSRLALRTQTNGGISIGQRMRADLAMMLLHSPELIILDEPTIGLDVVAKRQMIDFLKRINRDDGDFDGLREIT